MKKIFLTCLTALAAHFATAQNIQLHYDFGRHFYQEQRDEIAGANDRMYSTITLEQFKADRLGSWFYFVDLDLGKRGIQGAYTEISREFNITPLSKGSKFTLAGHLEFDGGLKTNTAAVPQIDGSVKPLGTIFQPAVLVGPAVNWHNSDFSATCSLQLMYKQYFKGYSDHGYSSFQLTGVWNYSFARGKGTFSGFADLYREERWDNGHGCLVFLAEPQLWYNVRKCFAVGTEVEVSNNFVNNIATFGGKRFFVNPTLAVKFTL